MGIQRNWNRGRLFVRRRLMLIAAGVVLALGIVLVLLQYPGERADLPGRIGMLKLSEIVRGSAAVSLLSEMHSKNLQPVESIIGTYRGENGSATVYLSVYDDPRIALLQSARMADRIEYRPTPFNGFQRLRHGDIDVSSCIGMGRPQYFFAYRSGVYWIAADQAVGQQVLDGLITMIIR
jgi:hypothetical protein